MDNLGGGKRNYKCCEGKLNNSVGLFIQGELKTNTLEL